MSDGTGSPAGAIDRGVSLRPKAPQSLEESGLTLEFLAELISKILLRGRLPLRTIAATVRLPPSLLGEALNFLRNERFIEVSRGGATEADAEFQLTESGRIRANDAQDRCKYAGPAPVALNQYLEVTARQSLSAIRFAAQDVRGAFRDLVLPPQLVDQLGAAMNSGRAVLLYGPAGSGKTYLAERFAEQLSGSIAVPYALTVGGEIIQIFDPLVHHPLRDEERSATSLMRLDADERWILCHRPVVMTGGELTLSMLDLQLDDAVGYYQAPPHVKANGGVLIIDDLGRQLVEPRQLMNRWIVPLEKRRDYLSLVNGFKFAVPFDLWVLFSTNLRPSQLADEAFLRRFGYKLFVGPMTLGDYREVFRRVCAELTVAFEPSAFDWLIAERHAKDSRPLLACYPRDLVGRIRDFATYEGTPARMSEATLASAWDTYFVASDVDATWKASKEWWSE